MGNQSINSKGKNGVPQAETNKSIAWKSNRIAMVSSVAASLLAIAALVVSIISTRAQLEDSFYERIFQPMVYTYSLDTDPEEMQNFEGYQIPKVICTVDILSGFPQRVATINSDEGIEDMYGINSKGGVDLGTKYTLEFELPFTSVLILDDVAYQFIFVYIEGADGGWDLDCLALSYNQSTGQSGVYIYDELDLLRLEYIQDEALQKILLEYRAVYQAISEIL